jgi:N-acetylmuramoyl-L-alanine amidase/putative methionine-R-sulfoxide reductase with GAF domain
MATTTTKPDVELADSLSGENLPAWPTSAAGKDSAQKASHRDALQALLAFSALHEQVRRRKALATRYAGFDSHASVPEFDSSEQFVLDEVLQLVAERAVAITGADGLAIALAENNEIVLRASAGMIRPDKGARIDRDSAFSGACFRTAQIITCDDTEVDARVNVQACRKLGARSMVAVPLCGRRRVIGVLEAFSSWPFGFNDSDIRNLTLLAELVLGALKPEDEDRFAQSAQVAATKLEAPKPAVTVTPKPEPPKPIAAAPAIAEPAKPAAPAIAVQLPTPAPPETAKPPIPAAASQPVVAVPQAKPVSTETAKPLAVPIAAKTADPAPSSAVQISKPPIHVVLSPSLQVPPKPSIPTPAELATKKIEAPQAPAAVKTPPVGTIPQSDKLVAAPASAIPPADKSVTEPKSALDKETVAAAPPEPILTFGQTTDESSQRPWMLLMLVAIVVATAFAAGIWWKLKTNQIGSQMVHNQPVQPQVETKPAPAPAPTTPVAEDEASDSDNKPDDSPATPQELAKFPRVTGVRHWSSADSSTVVLDLEDQVQYEPGHLPNPERFYFDLRDTQLASELQGKSLEGDSLLSHIRIAQPLTGTTRVVLEARGSNTLSAPQVSLERDPYRLVIQVSKAGANPKTAVNLFPKAPEAEKSKLAIVVPPPTKEDLQLRSKVSKLRIVVDAGHGGWDLGTVGRRGLLEKDLVLEIAQRLGKLLQSRLGADVIYTRPDDNYIPLDQRAVIANQAQADLFVSVHANYSDTPSARGVETYYANFFSAPGSKDLSHPAGPKEAAMRSEPPRNTPIPTLTPGELHDRIEQSRRLANSVQHSLYGALAAQNPGIRDRGIKEAGFVVLTESAMPGILAEVSFVSSPTDEQKLRSDGYREQIAEALYKGIARYAANSKGVKVAAKQSTAGGGQ